MYMAAQEGLFVLEGRPTAQLIADQLREQIVQGIFRPGEQINESVLASQLHTSRGPVREAMESAAADALLDAGQEQVEKTCQALKSIISDMAKQVAVSDWQAIA